MRCISQNSTWVSMLGIMEMHSLRSQKRAQALPVMIS